MWDNANAEQTHRTLRLIRKVLSMILAAVVLAGGLLVYFNRDRFHTDDLRRWFKYLHVRNDGTYGTISYDVHNSNRYAALDNGLAVSSVAGLTLYDMYGQTLAVSQCSMSLPVIQRGSGVVMAYDSGGTGLVAMDHRGREVLRLDTEEPIFDADISAADQICCSTILPGYKSVLTVYNERQEKIYRWLSSSAYMPLCAVSPNGKDLAAVGLDQKDGVFCSTLNLLQTDQDHICRTVHLGNELFYDICYADESRICLIGETGVVCLSSEGELLHTWTYDNMYLKDFHLGGDGFLALSLNMYRAGTRYALTTLDSGTGQPLGELYIGREILDISACGKYLAVLTSDQLTIYDKQLNICHQTDQTGNADSVEMRPDGSVILLASGKGVLYLP